MGIIKDKYTRIRPQITDGDLILFRGTKIVSKIIQWADKSYYNHIGVVTERHGALFIVDANASGVQADRLSYRVDSYGNGCDLTIIKPYNSMEIISGAMEKLLLRSDKKTIKYDFLNGTKELFNRKIKNKLKINADENKDICSDFVSVYAMSLGMVTDEFSNLRIAFPQDYIRYRNITNTTILE